MQELDLRDNLLRDSAAKTAEELRALRHLRWIAVCVKEIASLMNANKAAFDKAESANLFLTSFVLLSI